MFRILVLASLLLVGIRAHAADGWESVESTRWVPVTPFSEVGPTCKLQDSQGEPLRGTWRVLDSDDTLRFAVRGSGMLRVETRAIVEEGERSTSYRIGVRTAPSTVRRLVRKSEGITRVRSSCADGEILVLETDRWETELVAGSESVDVFLRDPELRTVLVRVLARGEIERPQKSIGDETHVEWDFSVGMLGAGFTTNAYLAPTDSASAETAFFLPVDIRAGARIQPGDRLVLDFDYAFDGVLFRDTILNVYRHRLEARQRWKELDLGALGEGRLDLDERINTKNRTYFGRGYDEELETAAGNPPAQDSYLADRFDWREYSVTADLEIDATDQIEYGAALGYVRKDYVQDYENDPDTYALDWGGVNAQARATWRNDNDLYVGISAAGGDRRYDEKFSRDAGGTVVRGVASHLSYWPVDLEVGRRPRFGLRWEAGIQRLAVIDHYEGYWDRTYWRFTIGSKYEFRQGHHVSMHVIRSVTDYEQSRVGNTPAGPIREKDAWLVGISGEYLLGRHWRAMGMLEYLDRNNNSPDFDYSLIAGLAGLTWQF